MRGRHNLIVPLSLLGLHQCQGRNTTSSDHQYFREESKLNYIENMFLKVCSIEITTTQVEGTTHKFEDRTNARLFDIESYLMMPRHLLWFINPSTPEMFRFREQVGQDCPCREFTISENCIRTQGHIKRCTMGRGRVHH